MFKPSLICLLAILPTIALADRTIVTPSGYTTPSGYDFETFRAISGRPRALALLDSSYNNIQFEGAYTARQDVSRISFGAQALVLPETFVTPEVSVGVSDLFNTSGRFSSDGFFGRSYYLALSKSLDTGVTPPAIHGLVFTGGLGGGGYHGLFGGAGVALPVKLIGTAEYDSRRMNYRLALPVGKTIRLSLDRISGSTSVSFDIHSPISL